MTYRIYLLFLISLTTVLAGCLQTESTLVKHETVVRHAIIGAAGGGVVGTLTGVGTTNGMAIGAGVGSLLGYIMEKRQSVAQRLAVHGVKMVQIGDNVKLILPTDRFFYRGTSRLNSSYFPVLNDVITLLNGFEKIDVRVIGFTDNVGSAQRNLALSRQQAQNIANYLWSRGADMRMLYADGCGEDYPIVSNRTAQGRAENRRIEISLLQLPKGS